MISTFCADACHESVLLGEAHGGHAVMYWSDYGVVCPSVVTTNGSLRTLMRSWAVPVALTPAGAAFFVGRAMYSAARRDVKPENTPPHAAGGNDGQR